MLINQKQLKRVAVETQSGQFLGYISDFELDTDTGEIEKYYVRNKKLIPGLFENNLMINKSQIIDFNEKKMIVEDAFVKAKAAAKSKLAEINNLEGTEPVITSQTNDQ